MKVDGLAVQFAQKITEQVRGAIAQFRENRPENPEGARVRAAQFRKDRVDISAEAKSRHAREIENDGDADDAQEAPVIRKKKKKNKEDEVSLATKYRRARRTRTRKHWGDRAYGRRGVQGGPNADRPPISTAETGKAFTRADGIAVKLSDAEAAPPPPPSQIAAMAGTDGLTQDIFQKADFNRDGVLDRKEMEQFSANYMTGEKGITPFLRFKEFNIDELKKGLSKMNVSTSEIDKIVNYLKDNKIINDRGQVIDMEALKREDVQKQIQDISGQDYSRVMRFLENL